MDIENNEKKQEETKKQGANRIRFTPRRLYLLVI